MGSFVGSACLRADVAVGAAWGAAGLALPLRRCRWMPHAPWRLTARRIRAVR